MYSFYNYFFYISALKEKVISNICSRYRYITTVISCIVIPFILFIATCAEYSFADTAPSPTAIDDMHMSSVSEFDELVVTVNINYEDLNGTSNILKMHDDGDILMPKSDVESLKLNQDYYANEISVINNVSYVNLSKLPNAKCSLDDNTLSLKLNFPADAMPFENIDVHDNSSRNLENSYKPQNMNAFFMNYNLTATNSGKNNSISGMQNLNFSNAFGLFTQSFIMTSTLTPKAHFSICRLDTNWTTNDDKRMVQFRVGDSTTASSDWSSATRFFGFQYATDFSTNPNLITYPLMDFQGRADLPSVLDVYINSQKVYERDLKVGKFSLDNLPISSGQGDVKIIQKDINGKIHVINMPFYVFGSLLKKGLTKYSYAVGAQRLKYGTDNGKYGNLVTSFDYNEGITDNYTAGVHFESMRNVYAVGMTNMYNLKKFGTISLSVATNLPNISSAQKLVFGYNVQMKDMNFSLQKMTSGNRFMNTFTLDSSGVRNSTGISIGYTINQSSSINASLIDGTSSSGAFGEGKSKIKPISLGYQLSLGSAVTFGASYNKDLRSKGSTSVAITFGYNASSASANVGEYVQNGIRTHNLSASIEDKKFTNASYSIGVAKNVKYTNYGINAKKSFSKMEATFFTMNSGGQLNQQLSMNGSVVFTKYGVFLTKQILDSFGVVKANSFKNVQILYNNNPVAKTNKNGIAFIPNIYSYIDSTIALDTSTLPLTAQFSDAMFNVNAKRNSGIFADFSIAKAVSCNIKLVDENDVALADSSTVNINGLEGSDLFVGYDGKVYIDNVKTLKILDGTACDLSNVCCKFKAEIKNDGNADIIDAGKQICRK